MKIKKVKDVKKMASLIEENENVVREFLDLYDYELINIECDLPKGVNMPEVVRLYPHKVKGEGQFVALLKKKAENYNSNYSGLKLTNSKITKDFIKNNLNIDFDCFEYKNYNYFVPSKDAVKKHNKNLKVHMQITKIKNPSEEFAAMSVPVKIINPAK